MTASTNVRPKSSPSICSANGEGMLNRISAVPTPGLGPVDPRDRSRLVAQRHKLGAAIRYGAWLPSQRFSQESSTSRSLVFTP
jgi:hypothetical protein